jgi:uncharacterized RDD family membrane protein YckC
MSADYATTSTQVDIGTHWLLRIVAAIIDSIPWTITSWVIWWVLIWNARAPLAGALGGLYGLVWIFLFPIFYGLLWVIYSTVFESSASAATPGERVMGLKMQMLDGSKQRPIRC